MRQRCMSTCCVAATRKLTGNKKVIKEVTNTIKNSSLDEEIKRKLYPKDSLNPLKTI